MYVKGAAIVPYVGGCRVSFFLDLFRVWWYNTIRENEVSVFECSVKKRYNDRQGSRRKMGHHRKAGTRDYP